MATLSLQIDPNQAINAAKTFMKVVEDIQRFIQNVDASAFTKMPAQIQSVIEKIGRLHAVLDGLMTPLNTFSRSVNELVQSDPGGKLAMSFSRLRDMLREVRTTVSGLGVELKNAATQLSNIGVQATRQRNRAPAPPPTATTVDAAQTATQSNLGTAIVDINNRSSQIGDTAGVSEMTKALTILNVAVDSVRSSITGASTAVTLFSERSISASSSVRILNSDLNTLLLNMGRAQQVASQSPSSRNLLGPGNQQAVQPFVFEATGGFDSSAERFKTSMRGVGEVIDSTAVTKDRFRGNVRDLKRDMDNANPSNSGLFRGLIALQIVFGGFTFGRIVSEIKQFTDELYQTGERLQILKQTFLAAAGGEIQEAAHNFEVARRLAKEFGADLLTVANNTARLQAASRGSNVEGEKANIIARGATAAVAVLGSNSEKASNVIKVFTDVLSKGRVQSEELVKQFGNAVPGAFRLAAEGMGLSVTQLTEAMQRGTLVAGNAAVQIAQALLKVYEALAKANSDTLKGSFANLGSAYTELKEQILAGGAEAGLIAFYKTLTATLGDPKVLEAARALGELLGKTLTVAVSVLTFAIEAFAAHWQIFTALIIGFVGVGALVSLASTIGLVIIGLGAFGTAAVAAGGIAAFFAPILPVIGWIAGFVAILGAGALAVLGFVIDTDKISEALKKSGEAAQKAFDFISKANTNAADIPRAFNDALQSVEKEIRTFNQDLDNQAQILDLLGSGVSSLSSEFDAYTKVLERVRALERSNKFESLDASNADAIKRQVTDIFLQMERVNAVLTQAIKLQKDLDQLQETAGVAQTTFGTVARTAASGNVSPISFELQEEYDRIVIPALKRGQEQLQKTTDPAQVKVLNEFYDNFSKSVQRSVLDLRQAQDAMRALVGITEDFRELTLQQGTTALLSGVRFSTDFIRGQVGSAEENKRAIAEFSKSQQIIVPPKIRSIGDELQEGFDPSGTGRRMGESFVEVFTKSLSEMEAKFKNLFPQLSGGAGTSGSGDGAPGGSSPAFFNANQRLVYDTAIAAGNKAQLNRPQMNAALGILYQESAMGDEERFMDRGRGIPGDKRKDGSYRSYGPGQMGVREAAAMGYSAEDRLDLVKGTEMSVKYYASLLKGTRGNVDQAILNYNGGGDPTYLEKVHGGVKAMGLESSKAFGGGLSGGRGAGASFEAGSIAATEAGVERITMTIEKESVALDKTTEAINNHIKSYSSAVDNINQFNAVAGDVVKRLEGSTVGLAQSELTEAEARDAGNAALERYNRLAGTAATNTGEQASRLIGVAVYYDKAKRQADSYNLSLDGQIKTLQAENGVLEQNDVLREAAINKIRRYYDAINSSRTAFDPDQEKELNDRITKLGRQDITRTVQADSRQSDKTLRDLGFEKDSLSDDTIVREANLEARKALFDLAPLQGQIDDREYRNRLRQIESIRLVNIELIKARGPIQQYIDSIGDFGQRVEEIGVGALDSFGDALATFATTGEFSFKNFINGITSELLKLYFQIAVIKPLLEGLKADSGSSGGGVGGTILNIAGAFAKAYVGSSGAGGSGDIDFSGGSVSSSTGSSGDIDFATGGWIGRGGTIHRFENGGLVGNDTIPAMVSPGEIILNGKQQKELLGGRGGSDSFNFSVVINATDGDSVKQSVPQVLSQIHKNLQRNAKRNGLERR